MKLSEDGQTAKEAKVSIAAHLKPLLGLCVLQSGGCRLYQVPSFYQCLLPGASSLSPSIPQRSHSVQCVAWTA